MRKQCLTTALVVALVGGVGVAATPAKSAEPTHCVAEFDVTLSPGLSSSPSSGTYTTDGETGAISCDGPVNGHQPTGIGRRGEHGTFGVDDPDTCASGGEGTQILSFTIPTAGGDQRVTDRGTFTYGPLEGGGAYGGSYTGERMRSTFQITPIEGDCVTTPVTRVHVRCEEWFLGEQ
jgi:hypothetical protein